MKRNLILLICLAFVLTGCWKPKTNPPIKPLITQSELWASLNGTWTSDDKDVFVDFRTVDNEMLLSIGLWNTEAYRSEGTITEFKNLSQYEASFTVSFAEVPSNALHDGWPAESAKITVDYELHPSTIRIKLPSNVAFGHAYSDYLTFSKDSQLNWEPPLPQLTATQLWNTIEGTWYSPEPSVVLADFRFDGDSNPVFAVALYQTSQGRINGQVEETLVSTEQNIVSVKVNFPAVNAIGDQPGMNAYQGVFFIDYSDLQRIKIKLPKELSFDQLDNNYVVFEKGEQMIIGEVEYNPYDLVNLLRGTWYSTGKNAHFVDWRFDSDNMPKVAIGLKGTTGRTNGRIADFEVLSMDKMRLYLYFPEVEAQGDNPALTSLEVTIEVDYSNQPSTIKILLPIDLCDCSGTSNDSYTKGTTINVDY
jgi:hypothetical protein